MLFGLYRGFIQSVLSLGGSLLSIVGSFLLYPHLADIVASNTDITRMISTYTDSQSLLGDLDLSSQAVSGLAGDAITQVVQKANLPTPIDTLLQHNLSAQVFRPLGSLATNVGDYVNQTILSVSINVLCFLLCFVACFIVVHILINLVRAVFRFPVLKHLDWLAGGVRLSGGRAAVLRLLYRAAPSGKRDPHRRLPHAGRSERAGQILLRKRPDCVHHEPKTVKAFCKRGEGFFPLPFSHFSYFDFSFLIFCFSEVRHE